MQWSNVSGPGDVSFENAAMATTHATFNLLGTYVLQLVASDSQLSATDQVSITVYPFNQPPVAEAGPDQIIFIPDPAVLAAGRSNTVFSKSLLTGRGDCNRTAMAGLMQRMVGQHHLVTPKSRCASGRLDNKGPTHFRLRLLLPKGDSSMSLSRSSPRV